ncbi:MAG: hypothetical protein FJW61_05820 [Actinobacteria bacterium]|nr:hypothetical protein [Actinomycetota bacterium]
MARRVYFREVYFYIVCLIALILFIVGLVMLFNGTLDYIKPTMYATPENIAPMYKDQNLTQEEIDKLVEKEINNSLNIEKNRAFKDLLRGALLVVIAIPLFVFHWKKAQVMWHISLETKDTD